MRNFLIGVVMWILLVGGFVGGLIFVKYVLMPFVDGETGTMPEIVACPADAMLCPDGSAVGRTGPDCSFPACPTTLPKPEPLPLPQAPTPSEEVVACNPANRPAACTKEYRPVCGLLQVQCITTPCNPVPTTYGNACDACAQNNVLSYTQGACVAE